MLYYFNVFFHYALLLCCVIPLCSITVLCYFTEFFYCVLSLCSITLLCSLFFHCAVCLCTVTSLCSSTVLYHCALLLYCIFPQCFMTVLYHFTMCKPYCFLSETIHKYTSSTLTYLMAKYFSSLSSSFSLLSVLLPGILKKTVKLWTYFREFRYSLPQVQNNKTCAHSKLSVHSMYGHKDVNKDIFYRLILSTLLQQLENCRFSRQFPSPN